MNPIRIRRVERSDLNGCFALEKCCYRGGEVAPVDFIEKRIEIYPDGFFVAEADGKIVGMVNGGATHKDDITDEELKYLIGHVRNGRNSVIFSLAVHPEYRGRGIARILMQKMFEISAKKEKQRILLLCCEELMGFYRSLGFTYGGPSNSYLDGSVMHQMQYDLPIPAWIVASHHNSAPLSIQ